MKRVCILATLLLATTAMSPAARATEVGRGRNLGLGFQLGDPTALVGKYFVGGENAVDFGIGFWGYGSGWCYDRGGRRYHCGGDYQRWSLHGDFLWQAELVRGTAKLDWHIGPGGRIFFADDNAGDSDIWLQARMPVGLDLTFDKPGFLEVFFELAPALFVIPFVDFDVDAALGVRFFF